MNVLRFGYRLTIAIVVVIAGVAGLACDVRAANDHPVVLVFDSVAGEGVSKEMAESATRAVRTYFRETRRVEAVVLNADSPTVLRAVMEKKLTVASLKNDTTREQRVEIARALGFEYAAAAEMVVKNDLAAVMQGDMPKPPKGQNVGKDDLSTVEADFVQVKLWLSKVDGGRREQWDSTQAAMLASSKEMDLNNAVQSAVSAAVLDLTRKAFAKVAPTEQIPIPSGQETVGITPELPVAASPTAADYSAKGDQSIQVGNVALAIQQYSQAVSADPSDGRLRIKLAEAYARKGLYEQAEDELSRALLIGVDKAMVDASRARVGQMKSGAPISVEPKPEPVVEPQEEPKLEAPKLPPPAGGGIRMTSDAVAMANARMMQGDQLWNKGEPDSAAVAYTEAIRLNPREWRGYERLAAVNASMSLFAEARKSIDQLKRLQPEPDAETTEKRYEMFRKAFDRAFAMLLTQLDAETSDFEKKVITRESYYTVVNGIGIRLENMTKFLDALVVPPYKQPANLRRSIACGLVAQATTSILDYLETNNQASKKNADTFIAQAKKESQEAAKLDINKIVIKKEEPARATPVTPAAAATPQPANQQESWDEGYYDDWGEYSEEPANYDPTPM